MTVQGAFKRDANLAPLDPIGLPSDFHEILRHTFADSRFERSLREDTHVHSRQRFEVLFEADDIPQTPVHRRRRAGRDRSPWTARRQRPSRKYPLLDT